MSDHVTSVFGKPSDPQAQQEEIAEELSTKVAAPSIFRLDKASSLLIFPVGFQGEAISEEVVAFRLDTSTLKRVLKHTWFPCLEVGRLATVEDKKKTKKIYRACTYIDGKLTDLGRFILSLPANKTYDTVNGKTTDLRRSNLSTRVYKPEPFITQVPGSKNYYLQVQFNYNTYGYGQFSSYELALDTLKIVAPKFVLQSIAVAAEGYQVRTDDEDLLGQQQIVLALPPDLSLFL